MGYEHFSGSRRCSENLTKAIDGAALQVNASKERRLDAPLTLAQELPCLLRALDVAGK
jgi:hypothetical protein